MLRPLILLLAALGACAPSAPPPTVVIPAGPPSPSLVEVEPSASSSRSAPKPPGPIVWERSEADARDRARRTGRPLLVYARAEWDAATLEMERKTWTDARVLEAARPFVMLRLDLTDTEGDAERYAEKYEIKAVPTIVVIARGRRTLDLVGYWHPDKVAADLRRAAEE